MFVSLAIFPDCQDLEEQLYNKKHKDYIFW